MFVLHIQLQILLLDANYDDNISKALDITIIYHILQQYSNLPSSWPIKEDTEQRLLNIGFNIKDNMS
jgi:hypothetical protein